ncbi:MAG: hypothetical protein MJ093_09190 [Saccharofermentans sp.]|nr:hypothetical protein [Saccharofermentans sp.]
MLAVNDGYWNVNTYTITNGELEYIQTYDKSNPDHPYKPAYTETEILGYLSTGTIPG